MSIRAWILVLAMASGAAAPAMADVVSSSDSGFVTRSEATVAAKPERVWADLLAPAKWWDSAHTWSGDAGNLYLDPQATGCFCELLPLPAGAAAGTPRGSVEHMHLIQVRPGKLLRMTGGLGPLQAEPVSAVLTVSLDAEGEGTRMVFEYRVSGLTTIKGGDIAGPVDGVLAGQLARLATWSSRSAAPAPE